MVLFEPVFLGKAIAFGKKPIWHLVQWPRTPRHSPAEGYAEDDEAQLLQQDILGSLAGPNCPVELFSVVFFFFLLLFFFWFVEW